MRIERVAADELGEPVTCSCQGVPFLAGLDRAEMGALTAEIRRAFGEAAEVCLHADGGLSVARVPGAPRVGIRVRGDDP